MNDKAHSVKLNDLMYTLPYALNAFVEREPLFPSSHIRELPTTSLVCKKASLDHIMNRKQCKEHESHNITLELTRGSSCEGE